MSDWKPDICIYHDPCDDGFAAAWAVWDAWGGGVDYRPTNYERPLPFDGVDGKNVLIVDFSFPADTLRDLGRRAASVIVLDHHKTARDNLAGFMTYDGLTCENASEVFEKAGRAMMEVDLASGVTLSVDAMAKHERDRLNVAVVFDMGQSGAGLTWAFCHPGETPPALISIVEDRDLWKFHLEHTRAVSLYLRSLPRDFATWAGVMERYEVSQEALLRDAYAIEQFYDRMVADIVATATERELAGHRIPVAHAPYAFASDVGHKLLAAFPDAPFAATICDAYGGRSYSLRSEDIREDVSVIAQKFGGGGHRNSAGFRVPAP